MFKSVNQECQDSLVRLFRILSPYLSCSRSMVFLCCKSNIFWRIYLRSAIKFWSGMVYQYDKHSYCIAGIQTICGSNLLLLSNSQQYFPTGQVSYINLQYMFCSGHYFQFAMVLGHFEYRAHCLLFITLSTTHKCCTPLLSTGSLFLG
jgi:hypothetical protein